MTTTTTREMAAWAENARIHALRPAMWEWHMDTVGGRTRLVKDIACEHGANKQLITRAYLRVSAWLRPNALTFKDLDAYAAAWRNAIVEELSANKAMVNYCLGAALNRRVNESRCYRRMNGEKTHHKVRAHRAWRRNAERMARKWL